VTVAYRADKRGLDGDIPDAPTVATGGHKGRDHCREEENAEDKKLNTPIVDSCLHTLVN
jgi:hypothetical protein